MTVAAEKLRKELVALDPDDRAQIAHFLIETLETGADANAEQKWDEELERRAEEIEGGRAAGESADKVFSELHAKYS